MADPGQPLHDDPTQDQPESHKPVEDNQEKDDPATTAARENLKHATISDKEPLDTTEEVQDSTTKDAVGGTSDKIVTRSMKAATPEPVEPNDVPNAEMIDHIASPKKKRGREQYDETQNIEEGDKGEGDAALSNGSTVQGRTSTGPERKRHRDASEEISAAPKIPSELKVCSSYFGLSDQS